MIINEIKVKMSIVVVTALLCVAWGVAVWVYEYDQYNHLTEALIDKQTDYAKTRGETISADVQRSLRVMHGIPEVLASWGELISTVENSKLSAGPEAVAVRFARLKAQSRTAQFMHLNHLLELAKNDFSVDVIWVINTDGNCIAASNFDVPFTFIGTNYNERSYFNAAMRGESGYQFAVGKITHTPGLYFSAPVFSGKKIIGVVVVKLDIARLAHHIDFSNVFVIDENGVAVLAGDQRFAMKAVPGNTVKGMSYERRQSVYLRDQFEQIDIQPWPGYARLNRVGEAKDPYVINITRIDNGDLSIYVLEPARSVLNAGQEFFRIFLLITLCGAALIFIAAGIIWYSHAKYVTSRLMQIQHDQLNQAQHLAKIGSWSYDCLSDQAYCSTELMTHFFKLNAVAQRSTPALTHVWMHAHPDDRQQVQAAFDACVQHGQSYNLEYRMLQNNGEVRNVIGNAVVEKNSKGQPVKITGTCRDVTEEQRAMRAIEDSENHLRRVLNSSLIGIIQGNDTGRILDMNAAFMSLTGYRRSDLNEGKLKWKNIAESSYQQLDAPNIFGHDNTPAPFEMNLTAASGAVIQVLTGMAKVEDAHSEWVCFVLDLSERNRVNRLQTEFISVVSHELRTPLTSIRGSLALLESGLANASEDKKMELIRIAHRNSERLIFIVNDILDMEKLAAGKMVFDMQVIDLKKILIEAIEFNTGFAQQFKVKFVTHDLPEAALIQGDASRVMQVLTNLMSNAAKFSPVNGVVDVRLLRRQELWRIEVQDHGPGISREFRSRIFGAFSQAEDANTRRKGGTGLGLNIAKIMVDKMAGEIGFESEPGQGATFWISFAAAAPTA